MLVTPFTPTNCPFQFLYQYQLLLMCLSPTAMWINFVWSAHNPSTPIRWSHWMWLREPEPNYKEKNLCSWNIYQKFQTRRASLMKMCWGLKAEITDSMKENILKVHEIMHSTDIPQKKTASQENVRQSRWNNMTTPQTACNFSSISNLLFSDKLRHKMCNQNRTSEFCQRSEMYTNTTT